jgi:hypothetical protein
LLDAPTERQRDIEAAEREDDKETES